MIKLFIALLCGFLASCAESSFARVSYDATFNMATCGNILNPSYYSPATGPEGFIDYRFYFSKPFSLRLNRDFSAILQFQCRQQETALIIGKYYSGSVNSGSLVFTADNGEELLFTWLNYYELYFSWSFFDIESGEDLTAVTLLHGTNIFSA